MSSPIAPARIYALCPDARSAIVQPAAPALEAGLEAAAVVTPLRLAHFMAQVATESSEFTRIEEDLDYRHPMLIASRWEKLSSRASALVNAPKALANAAYAHELGNGDEASGDGWRFRGRGLVQITGRYNYGFFGGRIGVDLVADPDKAADPAIAAKLALAFWKSRSCNAYADVDDIEGVTRCIAGAALTGLEQRRMLLVHAKRLFT